MGGHIAWTLRLRNGTEYAMQRWTNSMPGLILAPGFLAGDPIAIDAALEEWLSMKADWHRNRDSGDFDCPETPSYAPYPFGRIPSEYGIVVTDFMTDTILSLQGYTDLGRINAPRQYHGPTASSIAPESVRLLETYARAGRIKDYEFMTKGDKALATLVADFGGVAEKPAHDSESWVVQVPGHADYDALTAACDRLREDIPVNPRREEIDAVRARIADLPPNHPDRERVEQAARAMEWSHAASWNPFIWASARIDLGAFTLEEFDEGPEGYAAFPARLEALGFELTQDERAAWRERIEALRKEERAS